MLGAAQHLVGHHLKLKENIMENAKNTQREGRMARIVVYLLP